MTGLTSISNVSIQQILTSQLQAEQTNLAQLSEQLATGQEYTNLTDYAPSDALNLMNLQNSATQRQAYISVINTVQTRLSGYDTTMTDMESIVAQAQTLADGNPNFSATEAPSIASLAGNFLKSVSVDLNQQIGGRYIYAGSRYTTAPVADLSTLGAPSPTIYTDGATLPAYDADAATGSLTMAVATSPSQTVTITGTPANGQSASVTVNGTTYTYATTASDTADSVATGLAALIPGASVDGTNHNQIDIAGSGDTISASSNTTNAAAYATDSATIDSGYNVQYGVTSDNPAFQKLVAGLQYLQAAGNSTDAATYQANMTQASSLLTSALTGLDALHASVADNTNTLTAETTTQNNAINDITNQVDNIQQVDITQVSTELNLLQTQLQASYSATGTIERMSIVNYL
jgi:flagellar hook-associated protein 3 FlgL